MAAALDQAGVAEMDLPQENALSTMRPVGIKLEDVQPNKLTVTGVGQRQQGTIIIGPRLADMPGIRDRLGLVQASTAVHWALDPARRQKGKKGGLTRPSVSPTHQLRLDCPKCSHSEPLWWDAIFRKHSDQRKLYGNLPAFKKYAEDERRNKRLKAKGQRVRRGEPPILCEACLHLSTPQYVRMRVTHLTTAILPNVSSRKGRVKAVDAICAGLDDPLLDQLDAMCHGDHPVEPDHAFLPRLWAVYVRGMTPTDLPPHDAKGLAIDERLAATVKTNGGGQEYTYTIRPARVAFTKNGMATCKNFLMEANPGWTWGWVSEEDLLGKTDLDYTRRFMNSAKRQNGVGVVDLSV